MIKTYVKSSPELIQFPTINIAALPLKITGDAGVRTRCGSFIDDKGAVVDATKQTDAKSEANFDFWKNAETIKTLTNDAAGWKRAGQLHEMFCLWERAVSDKIHDVLYGTLNRRQNLRRYIWGKDLV